MWPPDRDDTDSAGPETTATLLRRQQQGIDHYAQLGLHVLAPGPDDIDRHLATGLVMKHTDQRSRVQLFVDQLGRHLNQAKASQRRSQYGLTIPHLVAYRDVVSLRPTRPIPEQPAMAMPRSPVDDAVVP